MSSVVGCCRVARGLPRLRMEGWWLRRYGNPEMSQLVPGSSRLGIVWQSGSIETASQSLRRSLLVLRAGYRPSCFHEMIPKSAGCVDIARSRHRSDRRLDCRVGSGQQWPCGSGQR